jgi:hypothetical protein
MGELVQLFASGDDVIASFTGPTLYRELALVDKSSYIVMKDERDVGSRGLSKMVMMEG